MINCCIIGYGYMGEIRKRILDRNDHVELVGIADPKPRPGDLDNDCVWVASYEELINREDVDAAFVCVPNALTPGIAEFALAHGKHVFCEKPPGRSVSDIKRIIRAEKKSACKVMFGFNHRFHPAMQEALSVIQSNRLGKLLWGRGLYGKAGGEDLSNSWRIDKSVSGGGILLDQGIHMLDLFRMYFGDFQTIKAFTNADSPNAVVEDNAFVMLKNNLGQHAILHSSASLRKYTFRLEMGLENGHITIEGFLSKTGRYGPETLTVVHWPLRDETRDEGDRGEERHCYDEDLSWDIEVENFVQAIGEDRAVEQCSSRDALRVMEIIEAAYKDAEKEG